MKILNSEELHSLKKYLFGILQSFDAFCNTHNFKYTLYAGTLLGSVRHAGFIPWDDDIDVAMRRDEYQKFLQTSSTQTPEGFYVQEFFKEKYYALPFAKFTKKNSRWVGLAARRVKKSFYIDIDIFPLDCLPKYKVLQITQYAIIAFLSRIISLKCGYILDRNIKKSILDFLLLPFFLLPIRTLKYFLHHIMTRYNYRLSLKNSSLSYVGGSYFKASNKNTDYCTTIPGRFESSEFPIPEKYDIILTKLYGNYMSPPPVDQRTSTHRVVSFWIGKDE